MTKSFNLDNTTGFTLMEMIIVIVLLGIIGVAGAEFVNHAFKGFSSTETRTHIYEEAKTGMVRMEREIHLAVPNAITISAGGTTVSFGLIDEIAMRTIFGEYTEDDPSGTSSITDRTTGLSRDTLISVYNTDWGTFSSGARLYTVTSNNINPMTLDANITVSSPYKRFFAVRDTSVQYQISGNSLYRLTADVNSSGVAAFANPKPLIKNIFQTDSLPYFDFQAGTSSSNARLSIHFTVSVKGESINFHKEIHIRNVP
ncbi:MAG: prepilin-type N-terminal cleavage/methylation domain-containing protein [Thermodesulfobacteriota bacterium]|nr:prepilin-type N-terminal cleavage/methylation domain-containing protein [Thermodesulfobacteriota bacterium]